MEDNGGALGKEASSLVSHLCTIRLLFAEENKMLTTRVL